MKPLQRDAITEILTCELFVEKYSLNIKTFVFIIEITLDFYENLVCYIADNFLRNVTVVKILEVEQNFIVKVL